jgi:hypothetical protein
MSLPSLKSIAINGGVLLIIGTGAVVFVKHALFTPATVACSERYNRLVIMNIKREGALMSPSDIQSVSAGRDVLVMENLQITPFKDAPVAAGLSVTLKAGTSQAENERASPGGISYPWKPRAVPPNLSSACLSYNVYLPADFEFDYAGTLPGMFGVSPQLGANDGERFATHVTWSNLGAFGSHVAMTTKANFLTETTPHDQRAMLPRGKWFRVDQEVILNTPGSLDGQVKLWIDGALRSQTSAAGMRKSADVSIQGVVADVFFGGVMDEGSPAEGRARKDETIRLTPFELRWN